jgi:extracellular factor (EF) 3-hydroxypalmitic acid methyl ester biosynthesis protein
MAESSSLDSTTESVVSCVNSEGLELQGTLLRLDRYHIAFELYGPAGQLRTSEAITDLKVTVMGAVVYSGRAVVNNLIHSNAVLVCEATLDEAALRLPALASITDPASIKSGLDKFLLEWGKDYKVDPNFKVLLSDMQTFFQNLRLWTEQLELAVRSEPAGDRIKIERQLLETIAEPVLPSIQPVLEEFETLGNRVNSASQPAYRHYTKRQLHPIVLCSPFLYRTYQKPLGYAGDYEMVRMMAGDPFEGASMFAKLVNRIFLQTPPVVAHQSRLKFLFEHLEREAGRAIAAGRPLRVFNIGCGPAIEIQEFLKESDFSSKTEFTLLDFNEETLNYTTNALKDLKNRHGRSTSITTIKKSVHHLIKDAAKPGAVAKYDLVYCAGLFDYLTDQVCKRLTTYMYDVLAPGGMLIATNVRSENPSRIWMDYVLDWHLIYRSVDQFTRVAPDRAARDAAPVQAIGDGVNIALVIRKPANGK